MGKSAPRLLDLKIAVAAAPVSVEVPVEVPVPIPVAVPVPVPVAAELERVRLGPTAVVVSEVVVVVPWMNCPVPVGPPA